MSGTFCAVTIDKAMYKDSGEWHIRVGTGNSLATLKKMDYVYPVIVNGKYNRPMMSNFIQYILLVEVVRLSF